MDTFELQQDKNKKIAFIYSLDDLFVFIVKIRFQRNSYFIGGEQPQKFDNLDDAKKSCRAHKVEEAYLALSNSYQELDATTDKIYEPMPRYDYQKISL